MRINIILLLSALTFTCKAELVTQIIHFDHNSAFLSAEERDVLRNVLPSLDEYFIEKIDIDGYCGFHNNQAMAQNRAQSIYGFLTSIFPDKGDYEIRIAESFGEIVDNSDCATIRVYYLKNRTKAIKKIGANLLFPEEFVKSVPTLSKDPSGRINAGEILFHGNSAVFLESSVENLDELAAYLNFHPSKRILLVGHVNGHAGKRYLRKAASSNPERKRYDNAQHLSLARAESIKEFLEARGIHANRIEVSGKGGTEKRFRKAQSSNEEEANRQLEIFEL